MYTRTVHMCSTRGARKYDEETCHSAYPTLLIIPYALTPSLPPLLPHLLTHLLTHKHTHLLTHSLTHLDQVSGRKAQLVRHLLRVLQSESGRAAGEGSE
jgi:hypothetical protein